MGVGGGVLDDAVDVTYSTKTDQNLGTAAAKLQQQLQLRKLNMVLVQP